MRFYGPGGRRTPLIGGPPPAPAESPGGPGLGKANGLLFWPGLDELNV